MRSFALVIGLLGGCDRVFGILAVGGPPDGSATIDNAPGCVGHGLLANMCPPGSITPAAQTIQGPIDTTGCSGAAMQALDDDTCVAWGTDITVGDTTVIGSRVLVVAATGALVIDGPLRIGALGNIPGPNGSVSCPPAAQAMAGANGVIGSAFGGGGAGGCGSGIGGKGGTSKATVQGGVSCTSALPVALHGGCPGANGGDVYMGSDHGIAGAGGGAVYLIGEASITLRGDILAGGGAGGGGVQPGGGGGGGGAGGMIAFDTRLFAIQVVGQTPRLCANGGSGGGGASSTGLMDGMPGENGCATNNPTTGGTGGGVGGNGGNGGATSRNGVDAAGAAGGGGGGGGAAGFIGMYGDDTGKLASAMISPPGSF